MERLGVPDGREKKGSLSGFDYCCARKYYHHQYEEWGMEEEVTTTSSKKNHHGGNHELSGGFTTTWRWPSCLFSPLHHTPILLRYGGDRAMLPSSLIWEGFTGHIVYGFAMHLFAGFFGLERDFLLPTLITNRQHPSSREQRPCVNADERDSRMQGRESFIW